MKMSLSQNQSSFAKEIVRFNSPCQKNNKLKVVLSSERIESRRDKVEIDYKSSAVDKGKNPEAEDVSLKNLKGDSLAIKNKVHQKPELNKESQDANLKDLSKEKKSNESHKNEEFINFKDKNTDFDLKNNEESEQDIKDPSKDSALPEKINMTSCSGYKQKVRNHKGGHKISPHRQGNHALNNRCRNKSENHQNSTNAKLDQADLKNEIGASESHLRSHSIEGHEANDFKSARNSAASGLSFMNKNSKTNLLKLENAYGRNQDKIEYKGRLYPRPSHCSTAGSGQVSGLATSNSAASSSNSSTGTGGDSILSSSGTGSDINTNSTNPPADNANSAEEPAENTLSAPVENPLEIIPEKIIELDPSRFKVNDSKRFAKNLVKKTKDEKEETIKISPKDQVVLDAINKFSYSLVEGKNDNYLAKNSVVKFTFDEVNNKLIQQVDTSIFIDGDLNKNKNIIPTISKIMKEKNGEIELLRNTENMTLDTSRENYTDGKQAT